MSYIIFGDEYESIKNSLPSDEIAIEIPLDTIETSIEFFNTIPINEADIIIINIQPLCQSSDLYGERLGVLFLKWIRVHFKVCNRVFLTGFESRETILKESPKDYILFAPSNYFIQLPFKEKEFSKIKQKTRPLNNEKHLIDCYRSFIEPDFDIKNFGHTFSNSYGIYLLTNLYNRFVENKTGKLPHNYLDYSKAELLFGSNNKPSESDLTELGRLRTIVKENVTKYKILSIDDQGYDIEDSKFLTINSGWFRLVEYLLDTKIDKLNPKDLLKGIERQQFTEEDLNIIANKVISDKPDIVLLDLRLLGDYDLNKPLELVSGVLLLKKIRSLNPSLSILLTTASNKLDTSDILTKMPYLIDDIWSKPRIEFERFNSVNCLKEFYNKITSLLKIKKTKAEIRNAVANYKLKLLETKVREDGVEHYFSSDSIDKFDYVIFDTNFFCDTSDSFILNQLALYLTTYYLSKRDKKIVVIDDVITEVFLNSIIETKPEPLKTASSFSMERLNRYRKKNMLERLNDEVRDAVNVKLEPIVHESEEKDRFDLYYSKKIFQSTFKTLVEANEKVNELKMPGSLVHADNIFQYLIRSLINNNKRVLFVANDIECKRNIAIKLNCSLAKVDNQFFNDYTEEKGKRIYGHKHKHVDSLDIFNDNSEIVCTLIKNKEFVKRALKNADLWD